MKEKKTNHSENENKQINHSNSSCVCCKFFLNLKTEGQMRINESSNVAGCEEIHTDLLKREAMKYSCQDVQ